MEKELKKILIITYFFPPANLAGIYRVFSWAKYLNKFGWYPVVVTRAWNNNQVEITDVVEDNTLVHEKYDNFEIYRVPYNRSLRDRLTDNPTRTKEWFGMILTFWEIFTSGFTNKWLPYKQMHDFSDELLSKDKLFKAILVTGRPFIIFKFAYLLGKKYNLPQVFDYRDEWNTHQWIIDETWKRKLITAIEMRREKKWVAGAAFVTTCSEEWASRIGKFTNTNAVTIFNGYDEDDFKSVEQTKRDDSFVIVHNGTLYATQNIKIFNEGLKMFAKKNPHVKIKLIFPGLTYIVDQSERVKQDYAWLGDRLEVLDRIPKKELLSLMSSADLLIMFGMENGIKGHHSSKIFEYLRTNVPILLSPTDCDVMEELIRETNTGYIGYSVKSVFDMLDKIYKKQITYKPDFDKIANYSREKQTEVLAQALDNYIK